MNEEQQWIIQEFAKKLQYTDHKVAAEDHQEECLFNDVGMNRKKGLK